MIVWKDILQPIQESVPHDITIEHAIQLLRDIGTGVVLVWDEAVCVGYLDSQMLMQQLFSPMDLTRKIEYKRDILKVPENQPVEFYHNISLIIGEDEQGRITCYNKVQDAVQKMNQLKLEQLNRILNGSGIGIVHTNFNFEISFVNEMAEAILGMPHSFLLNRNYKTLFATNKNLDAVMRGEHLVSVDSTLNYKHITGNISPLWIDGRIAGIVHIFFRKEQWEETVQELDFVRDMYADLQAIYSSSNEQIMVVNAEGEIIRLAGTFLKDFWLEEKPEHVVGKTIKHFEQKGIFTPNLVEWCMEKRQKLTGIQETWKGRRVWSVATPIAHEDKLEKVVIVSRDITEINQLKETLELVKRESAEYKQELDQLMKNHQQKKNLIYRSRGMENLVDEMRRIAQVDSTVLLSGESGVGKEVFAHEIHQLSKRNGKPFVRVNCGAISESLIESELFGYEKGAFTGADQKGKLGLFEQANEGTIFLDEISELPFNMQVKLLRVLQEKEITRVGGVKTIHLNVRVIAATNKNLKELVQANLFREDLFYRLNVIPLHIPPLRERIEDILPLSIHFLLQFNQDYQKEKNLSLEAMDVLENYNWPGNVRELHNIIERLVVTTKQNFIGRDDVLRALYGEVKGNAAKPMIFEVMPLKEAVDELETQLIALAMKKYSTAAKVSEILGVSQATISRKINRLLKSN